MNKSIAFSLVGVAALVLGANYVQKKLSQKYAVDAMKVQLARMSPEERAKYLEKLTKFVEAADNVATKAST